jgi:hypothetical protein
MHFMVARARDGTASSQNTHGYPILTTLYCQVTTDFPEFRVSSLAIPYYR